ncbi:hypothetical protein [Achromobacter sp. LC458]|uniref:hypothetical protein n=1 Tax=Achromobacter sp. LC458 TaxID=1120623 RepID=UPI00163D5CAA|nr:hypothetical protein [Achromobacter sp. LC458]
MIPTPFHLVHLAVQPCRGTGDNRVPQFLVLAGHLDSIDGGLGKLDQPEAISGAGLEYHGLGLFRRRERKQTAGSHMAPFQIDRLELLPGHVDSPLLLFAASRRLDELIREPFAETSRGPAPQPDQSPVGVVNFIAVQ